MRLAYTLLLAGMLAGQPAFAAPELTAEGQQLRQELLQMAQLDQAARSALDRQQVRSVDRHNTARMKEIIERYGWPGTTLVGEDGSKAAWVLIQHADADRAFQQRCLLLLKEAVDRKEASSRDLAYLTDRVMIGMGKPQRYGSQLMERNGKLVPLPIEDPDKLDARRAEIGLEPFKDYVAHMEQIHRDPPGSANHKAPESPPAPVAGTQPTAGAGSPPAVDLAEIARNAYRGDNKEPKIR